MSYRVDGNFMIYNNLRKKEEIASAISSWRSHLVSSLILTLMDVYRNAGPCL